MEINSVYMTQTGFKELNNQLVAKKEDLRVLTEARLQTQESLGKDCFNDPEMMLMIQQENSLKENIASLQNLLGRGRIIDINDSMRNTSQVRIGSIVKLAIYNVSNDKESSEIWEITGYNETNIKERKLSYNSPLAKNILSCKKGEVVDEICIPPNVLDIKIINLYKTWADAQNLN